MRSRKKYFPKSDMQLRHIALYIVFGLLALGVLGGCAGLPLNKDGELTLSGSTTASVEDMGAVRIKNQF